MRKPVIFLLALMVGLYAATAALAAPALAGSVRIQDDANVLSSSDRSNIQGAAANAPFKVAVWTSTKYTTQAAFQQAVQQAVGVDEVAIAVDPTHKYSYVAYGRNVTLTQAAAQQADQLANAQFGNSQWGAGMVTAIDSLAGAGGSSSGNTGSSGNTTNPAGPLNPIGGTGSGFSLGGCGLCLIPLLLIAVVAFFFFRNRGMNRGGAPAFPGNQMPPQYPNQGYGGPGGYPQQGGYYPPQQGSGIGGNIASGGLGALAGGAIGYELGRNAGEQQAGQQGGGGGFVGGGEGSAFGGGAGGSFGGGDSGGFSSGGGSDFGGGSGGSFGGGGDAGGSGGSFGGGGDSTV